MKVSGLGHDRHRGEETDAADHLEGSEELEVGAGNAALEQGRVEPPDPLGGGPDAGQAVIEGDLSGTITEAQGVEPGLVPGRPCPAHPRRHGGALAEQELDQMVLGSEPLGAGVVTGPDQVAVVSVWWMALRPTSWFDGSVTFITVKGTSMLPTLKTGDFVLAEAQPSYKVGDLVVYRVPRGQIGAGDDLIHRIVAGNATIGFTLKGDNNPAPDPWIVPRSDVLGKEALAVPGLGNSLLVIRSPLFAGLAAALIAMWLVISPPGWMRRRKPAAPASSEAPSAGPVERIRPPRPKP